LSNRSISSHALEFQPDPFLIDLLRNGAIPIHTRHAKVREISLHGGRNRFHCRKVLILFDDLRGDREMIILLMSEPEPSSDFREDVLDHFAIPQLIEDDDLVVSELIPILSWEYSIHTFRSGPLHGWMTTNNPETDRYAVETVP
jgi:hypothetical protein